MKLSVSNIGWSAENDSEVYQLMRKYGYSGVEIAPTRIFSNMPYDNCEKAKEWSKNLKEQYGFIVSSMQSIWFGKQERLFGTEEERKNLINYTKKAIDFAMTIDCKNLVFGCPRNRSFLKGEDIGCGINFFKLLGDYAAAKGTVISMEANPPIYNTNYINDTLSALSLIKQVDSKGFMLNLDVGTMIQNNEDISILAGNIYLINHVHISEPGLEPVAQRKIHWELREVLEAEHYDKFVSIEMRKVEDLSVIEDKLRYIRNIFI